MFIVVDMSFGFYKCKCTGDFVYFLAFFLLIDVSSEHFCTEDLYVILIVVVQRGDPLVCPDGVEPGN